MPSLHSCILSHCLEDRENIKGLAHIGTILTLSEENAHLCEMESSLAHYLATTNSSALLAGK